MECFTSCFSSHIFRQFVHNSSKRCNTLDNFQSAVQFNLNFYISDTTTTLCNDEFLLLPHAVRKHYTTRLRYLKHDNFLVTNKIYVICDKIIYLAWVKNVWIWVKCSHIDLLHNFQRNLIEIMMLLPI